MLSWHEGFGLTGWEAIAAQVPLIVSQESGLYKLVQESAGAPGIACMKVLDIQGQEGDDDAANFTEADEKHVRDAILEMVRDMPQWQQNAAFLKDCLTQKLVCTWEHTAQTFCAGLGLESSPPPAARVEVPPASVRPPAPELSAPQAETTAPPHTTSTLIHIPHLTWPDALKDEIPDRFLLVPASGVVPFHHHRHGLLQQHLDWVLAAEPPITLRLLAGPGGTGKTRLLIEVCRRLQAEHGWHAGFLQSSDHLDQELRALVQTARSCLIVVDYAETRAQDIVDLVRTAKSIGHHGPLRLVLLARGGGDWWAQLSDRVQDNPAVASILHSHSTKMGPYSMSEVDIALDERPAIFHEALTAFAAKTGLALPTLPIPDLSAVCFQHLLFLHLAALAALRGRVVTDQQELLSATLSHERGYWRRALAEAAIEEQYLDGFEQLLAHLTLIGGTRSAADTKQVIRLTPLLREAAPLVRDRLFQLLRPFYGRDGGTHGVEPDLLGERLVAEALAKDDELLDVVFASPDHTAERVRYAYTVLTRLARHGQHERQWLQRALERHLQHTTDDAMAVAMETGAPMPAMMAEVLKNPRTPARQKLINALRVQVPKETVNLLEFAVTIAEQHVALLTKKGSKKNFTVRLNAKDAYALLASRYQATGRFTEALGALQQALDFALAFASSKPSDANQQMLAEVYMSLAELYAKTGHFREALKSAQRAESILRTLARKLSGVYRPAWANALLNLGNRLGAVGRYGEALECTQQAEHIHRELAQAQPEVHRPAWAATLHNLGNCLGEVGRYAEALACTQQAEHIHRELAQAQPEVYRPDWAQALHNLGNCLGEVGRYREALECTQQAEHIQRELVQAQPEVYRPDWAQALHNLGVCLGEVGRYGEALACTQQAEHIHRELAQAQPEVYRPTWADALNNLGYLLNTLGRYTEALEHAQQAEHIECELAQAQPEVYQPDWAMSLCNVAEALFLAGEMRRALPPAEQASALYSALVARYPKTYQEHHGWCQRLLAEILLANGDLAHALGKAQTAVTVLDEMFRERPGYAPAEYGKALEVLARCQREREGDSASLQTLRRALRELEAHYLRHPAALHTVMQTIVASLRSLAPDTVEQEVPQAVLAMLQRHPADFATTSVRS